MKSGNPPFKMDSTNALKVVTRYKGLEEDKERISGEIKEIQTECAPLIEQIKQLNSKIEEFNLRISRKKEQQRKIQAILNKKENVYRKATRIIEERKEMKKLMKYAEICYEYIKSREDRIDNYEGEHSYGYEMNELIKILNEDGDGQISFETIEEQFPYEIIVAVSHFVVVNDFPYLGDLRSNGYNSYYGNSNSFIGMFLDELPESLINESFCSDVPEPNIEEVLKEPFYSIYINNCSRISDKNFMDECLEMDNEFGIDINKENTDEPNYMTTVREDPLYIYC